MALKTQPKQAKQIRATVQVSTVKTLVAVGCHTRWDVGTKSRVVKQILETEFPEKATYKERYSEIAAEYNVNYMTIHNWVKDFSDTCTTTQYALDGTLLISPTVIQGERKIKNTFLELKKIKAQLHKLLNEVETVPYCNKSAQEVKRGKTSNQQEAADIAIKSD